MTNPIRRLYAAEIDMPQSDFQSQDSIYGAPQADLRLGGRISADLKKGYKSVYRVSSRNPHYVGRPGCSSIQLTT